jgi:hypothetical protein
LLTGIEVSSGAVESSTQKEHPQKFVLHSQKLVSTVAMPFSNGALTASAGAYSRSGLALQNSHYKPVLVTCRYENGAIADGVVDTLLLPGETIILRRLANEVVRVITRDFFGHVIEVRVPRQQRILYL